MLVTRKMLLEKLADKSGYYQKDIKNVLCALDDVVLDCFGNVDDDEEIAVQLITGAKLCCKVMPKRDRVDPRTQEPIVVKETVKPFAVFSDDFREKIQNQYEDKNG